MKELDKKQILEDEVKHAENINTEIKDTEKVDTSDVEKHGVTSENELL